MPLREFCKLLHSDTPFAQSINEYREKLLKNNQKVSMQMRFSESVGYRGAIEEEISQVCFNKCKIFYLFLR